MCDTCLRHSGKAEMSGMKMKKSKSGKTGGMSVKKKKAKAK